MGECTERLRLVFIGLSQTGKTSVIKRFLFKTFNERYKQTVEELYYREFDLGHIKLKVDIMDTAGDMAFPAMRRLAIAGANAFVLMYSIDNVQSFEVAKQSFEEIREERKDFADIPILFVGNKSDLVNRKEVFKEDVCEWVFCELPKIRAKVMECSAKDDFNIKEIFRTLLQLSKYPSCPSEPTDVDPTSKLIRRSSAYVSNRSASSSSTTPRSYGFIRRMSTTSEAQGDGEEYETPPDTPSGTGVVRSGSGSSRFGFSRSFMGSKDRGSATEAGSNPPPSKPRSRSLIRRCSRKAKQQMRDAQVDDCSVS